MKISKTIKLVFLAWSICFHGSVSYSDCFQDVAQRSAAGLIEGFSTEGSWEVGAPILLSELETCCDVSGAALFVKLVENYARLKASKVGTEWEFYMNWGLCAYMLDKEVSPIDTIRILAPIWYDSNGKEKEVYFSTLSDFSRINKLDPARDRLWDFDFSIQKTLLNGETNKVSVLSLSLLDFMFALAPGRALLTLNDTLSIQEIETLKQTLALLALLHTQTDPESWQGDDLQSGKEILNNLISSNYAYIDLFIAEIVNVVHDVRTPEVDAFLKQSTHPLVQKRENEPFVYVPLIVPE